MEASRPRPVVRLASPAPEVEVEPEIVGGRYELRREAGRGGMCVVYEAQNRYTGRAVALKRLLPEFVRSADVRDRLLQEAVALGLVRHPNVVDVLDAGESDDGPYIVMELLPGRSLEGMLAARGHLTVGETLAVGRHATAALAAVHAAGIVHRDIKPGNLLIVEDPATRRRTLKLIDLGVARVPEARSTRKLTAAATVLGTPEYLPLELLTATGVVDPTADVYALGVALYECLAGAVPFPGNYPAVLRQAATMEPRPIHEVRPEVPLRISQFVMKCLAREPQDRFADGGAMMRALEAAIGDAGSDRPSETAAQPAAVQQRRFPRVPFITPVRVRVGANIIDCRSEDLSEAGLMVLMPGPLPEGTRVLASFALPRTGEHVACAAVVRWVRAREARACAVGLELIDVMSHVKEAIAAYVKSV